MVGIVWVESGGINLHLKRISVFFLARKARMASERSVEACVRL
jgi:hypothetical protein